MFDLNSVLAIAAFLLALGANICWAFITYGNAQKKSLAAERDFRHLQNNQLEISRNLQMEFREIDDNFEKVLRDLIELKCLMIGLAKIDT